MKHLVISIAVLFSLSVSAQNGILDVTFAGNGLQSFDHNAREEFGYEVVQTADGKLLAGGYTYSNTISDMFVIRLDQDGSFDTSFGDNGKAIVDFADHDLGFCLALQTDGKILIGGASSGADADDFAVVRLLADGSVDQAFGSNGLVLVEMGTGNDLVYDLAVQSDGKIVAVGKTSTGPNVDLALMRLNEDGTLDNGFGTGGKVTTHVVKTDYARAVALGPNGSIIVAGNFQGTAGDNQGILAKYNSDGSLDNTFGINGVQSYDFGSGDDELWGVAVDNSGKIWGCGRSGDLAASDMLLAKFNSDGTLDNSFSSDGIVTTDFAGGFDKAYSIVLLPDSKILIGGVADDVNDKFGIAGFDSNGDLDNTLGTGGKVTTQFGTSTSNTLNSLIVQSDLKIVACGYSQQASINTKLARYTSGLHVGIGEVGAYIGATLIYPNPVFSNSLTVEYELKSDDQISIDLFELSGKWVAQLQPIQNEKAGAYQKTLNIPYLSAGNYILKLNSEKGSVTVKFVVN